MDVLLAIGRLIASLHVQRSIPGGLHPTTSDAYDEVRQQINDFGWSTPEEIAKRIATTNGYERFIAIEAAAVEVMKKWDLLGPTGTEDTLYAHGRLRAALGDKT